MPPLETRTDSPGETHIQRNPVSAWQLEMKDPILLSQESFFGVPLASQEQGLSIGKARGTPGSCHHSKSPPDVSVHFRGTCFPCTASTFKPRIDSHHGGTWDSPVGKPRGKASRESHRSLDPREGKHDTARDPLPWGVTLVASGKASPHASCSGASRDSSPVDAGA